MTYSPYEPAPPNPGERWSLNLPVAIGVVFVFLVAVIAWVIVSSSDDDGDLVIDTSSTTSTTIESGPPIVPTSTTTPPLLPTTTLAGAPVPAGTTVPAATAPPAATQPPAPPPAPTTTTTPGPTTTLEPIPTVPAGQTVPGDLNIAGYPMQQPPCNGAFITILASAVGDQATPDGIRQVLEQYPNSNYLRTDQACRSLNPSVNGQPVYVVFFGPFAEASDACIARDQGPDGAYARELTNGHGHEETVNCENGGQPGRGGDD